jgi:DNA-binding XRE family transcriptional regulator
MKDCGCPEKGISTPRRIAMVATRTGVHCPFAIVGSDTANSRKTKKPRAYRENPQSLGDHLLRERTLRGLHQKDAAELIGVSEFTYLKWEKDQVQPGIARWPAIISFPGYDPSPEPVSLGERLYACRRQLGWAMRIAAADAGMDGGTWLKVESGAGPKTPRIRTILEQWLARISHQSA